MPCRNAASAVTAAEPAISTGIAAPAGETDGDDPPPAAGVPETGADQPGDDSRPHDASLRLLRLTSKVAVTG